MSESSLHHTFANLYTEVADGRGVGADRDGGDLAARGGGVTVEHLPVPAGD